MKLLIALVVSCVVLTGCVCNSNIAWRGQTDTYKYDISASTDGKITNAPSSTKGDSRLDAQKEYSDSFKTDADVSAGDGSNVNNTPEKETQPTTEEVKAPTQEEVVAPDQEDQPAQQ